MIKTRQEYVTEYLAEASNLPEVFCTECGEEMAVEYDQRSYQVKPCCSPDNIVEKCDILQEDLESMADHIDDLQDTLFILNTSDPGNQELEDAINNITKADLRKAARILEYMKNLTGEYRTT